MTFAVDNAQPEAAKPAPSIDADQVADVLLTSALLGAEEITPPRSKSLKNHVSIRIERVFRTRSTVYIHYEITNDTSVVYQVATPRAQQLQLNASAPSFSRLIHSQLDERALDKLRNAQESPLPVAHAESESPTLEPRQKTHGVLAVRRDLRSPAMIELVFGEGVKAVVVL